MKKISILVFDVCHYGDDEENLEPSESLEPLLKTIPHEHGLFEGVIYRLLHVPAITYDHKTMILNRFFASRQKVIEDYTFKSISETKETLQKIARDADILVHYNREFLEKYLERYGIQHDCEILDIYSHYAKEPGELVSIATLMGDLFGEYYQKYSLQNNIYLRAFCVLRLFAKTYHYTIAYMEELYKQVFRQCEKYQQLKEFIYKEQLEEFYQTTRYGGMLPLVEKDLQNNISNEHYAAYKKQYASDE